MTYRFAAFTQDLALLCAALLLAACTRGELNLDIADAPVDDAEELVIEVAGVELKPAAGDSQTITFSDPKKIDLLKYADGTSFSLLSGESLLTGEYDWVRLIVNAQTGVRDSYITVDGAEHELSIPEDALAGLTTDSRFEITRNSTSAFTIDFDLRKSVLEPLTSGADYRLRPSLRWVDNAEQGTLNGAVSQDMITEECADGDKAAVYLFSADVNVPDDLDGTIPDPITTARVKQDGINAYTIAFLEAGDYVVAFTCDAAEDQADTNDAGVVFTGKSEVTITAGETTTHDFVP